MPKAKGMKWYDWLAFVLLVVGGLNWGFVKFFGFNLAMKLSFGLLWLENIIYGAVFLSALYGAYMIFKLSQK